MTVIRCSSRVFQPQTTGQIKKVTSSRDVEGKGEAFRESSCSMEGVRLTTAFNGTACAPFVIPSVPGFPTSPLSLATTYVVLSKENHTQSTEAATLDRKSGEAEGSAVLRTSPGNVFRQPRDLPFLTPHPRQTSATMRTCSGPVRQQPPIHCAPAFRHLTANSPKSLICPSPCQHRSTASHSSPELG
jgi:hypothetical protein